MPARSVDIFFYGLFMDIAILQNQGVKPQNPRRAYVDGYVLRIGQRASLVPATGQRAYGMIIALTHAEIAMLYAPPGLQNYRPEAVLAISMESGEPVPALCYILEEPPAANEYNAEYAAKLRAVLQALNLPVFE